MYARSSNSRTLSFLAVLALHVVIVAAVLVFSRARFWRVTASTPLETQFLPAANKVVPLMPKIPPIQNASNNGRPQQVYCIRKKTARGDLFKDLPVYKKLHPDN